MVPVTKDKLELQRVCKGWQKAFYLPASHRERHPGDGQLDHNINEAPDRLLSILPCLIRLHASRRLQASGHVHIRAVYYPMGVVNWPPQLVGAEDVQIYGEDLDIITPRRFPAVQELTVIGGTGTIDLTGFDRDDTEEGNLLLADATISRRYLSRKSREPRDTESSSPCGIFGCLPRLSFA